MSQRIALGIGNTSVQAAFFSEASFEHPLPLPEWHRTIPTDADLNALQQGQVIPAGIAWVVASVNSKTESRVRDWVQGFAPADYRLLERSDFAIELDVDHPQRVGKDRLAAAIAVAAVREPNQAAIFIDAGTAITVNVIDAAGTFVGGAILPGTLVGARALSTWTDALPEISVDWRTESEPPAVIGKSTEAALASGIFWSAVGAVRELVQRMSDQLDGQPVVYVTGGFGHQLSQYLDGANHVPHLVVAGIALST